MKLHELGEIAFADEQFSLPRASWMSPMQVSGCAITGKGMLVNIGGKLLAAEQRDGGRVICAVFADNHIITIALWSHALEGIIGRTGDNILGEDASADRTNEDWQVTSFF